MPDFFKKCHLNEKCFVLFQTNVQTLTLYAHINNRWYWIIGPLHDPVTWYKIKYTGEQVAQWDFQNKGRSRWTGTSCFVLEVPLFEALLPCAGYTQPRLTQFCSTSNSYKTFTFQYTVSSCERLSLAGVNVIDESTILLLIEWGFQDWKHPFCGCRVTALSQCCYFLVACIDRRRTVVIDLLL